jgi:8-oxo-dGTP diphosphatase
MNANSVTDVAAAVLLKADGSFLLAQRPAGKPYAGYWEFPGGKVDAGESVAAALNRELEEELGITVKQAYPWLVQQFVYPHATVKLHFFRVVDWQGEPHPKENQLLSWQHTQHIDVEPLLPANQPILNALSLPSIYAITNFTELGKEDFFLSLEKSLQKGLQLLQVREKQLSEVELIVFSKEVMTLAHRYDARVILNGASDIAQLIGADGIHLSSAELTATNVRPDFKLCGASCHTLDELHKAAQLKLDYVLLGAVNPTLSHPGKSGMGWQHFSDLITDYPLPVYALGGMKPVDLETAWRSGAHGIAMQRAVWD